MPERAPELVHVPDLSKTHRAFYVPQFELKIEEAGLPKDVLRDVIELTYEDNLDEMDTFSLTVNNANDDYHALKQEAKVKHEIRRFKYIGSETAKDLKAGGGTTRYTLFEPCAKAVQVSMGYLGNLTLMMTGTFTTMAPAFSSAGASTLEVRGINALHQFRRKKYSDHWVEKKRSDVAELVARRRRRGNDNTAFELDVRTNRGAKSIEVPVDLIAQKNEYDIDFLWKLARAEGYILALREKTDTTPRHLYFGPSGGVASDDGEEEIQQPQVYVLEWGKSLIDFSPRITSANQFRSVTVNGWDRRRQRAISETIDFTDRALRRLNCDLHNILINCDPREELVVEKPVFTRLEARNRARALLLDQHKQMVTAKGTTIGLPYLRAGTSVDILGLGSRLNGRYTVTKTTHTINDSGYLTKFEARREHIPEVTECPPKQTAS